MATIASEHTKTQISTQSTSNEKSEYWIPSDPRSEKKLIKVLTKMVKHYMETHPEEFGGTPETCIPSATPPPGNEES